ncbi:ABC transporter ATP-binding protein [Actinophytocola sp.]|uniref:ABC transporter ATP-binding protein n=1 Tax=Actinophytocola sp. TaxID=1872138 RepID=UPI003D6B9E7F
MLRGAQHTREETGAAAASDALRTGDLLIDRLTVEYSKGSRDGHAVVAVDEVDLTVPAGKILALLGPSGCGKTSLLNAVAGLLRPAGGTITVGATPFFDAGRRILLPPERRELGMVFQSYSLWPHLSVSENVAYPLRRRTRLGRDEIAARVAGALELVRCAGLGDRLPGQLSGGQQQRIALARALVSRPPLVLFDEPLSNLDARLRAELRVDVRRLHGDIEFTGLYVTHDQTEAFAVGDIVAVMRDGRVAQFGEPSEVFRSPRSSWVAGFLGAHLVPGRLGPGGVVRTAFGTFEPTPRPHQPDGEVTVAFYPGSVALHPEPDGPARLLLARELGHGTEITLQSCDGTDERLIVALADPISKLGTEIGQRVRLVLPGNEVKVFREDPDDH